MKENRERSKYYDRDLLFTDFTGEGGGDKPWNRFQLRNTGYIDYFVIFFDPRGRYGRFYGIAGRSNRQGAVTGRPCWTDP